MSVPTVAPDVGVAAVEPKVRTRRVGGKPGAGNAVVPTLFMLAFLVYFLMPLGWLFIASTKSLDDLFSSFGLWFSHFNLSDNISETFSKDDGVYLDWLRNTLMYSFVSAGGAALLAAAAGYGFAKYDFRGKGLLFWFVLGSVMVPTTALAIPTYLMFSKLGFTNNPLSVILPSLVSPFGIYLMRIYAEASVPSDLIEAARIDGAGELLIFRRIAFRLLAPGFVTVLLFTFVATWNNYFLPLVMLSEPKWYPLTVGLAQWNAQATAGGGATASFNTVITGALISIVPLILAFTFLQRYWQSGLGSGGVKG
ncbi:MAG: carbohydrate ABC transporter permease [Solirubrobacteraceae bacterium]